MPSKNINTFILSFVSLLLLLSVFTWIDFLAENYYIQESFLSCTIIGSSDYENRQHSQHRHQSQNVNLPLNTTTTCHNFCGPPARCAITGNQCTSDIDCPGCQPRNPKTPKLTKPIPGNDDAGKLTFNKTPRYSTLTTDLGTKSRIIAHNKFSKSPTTKINNVWLDDFNKDYKQYQKYSNQDTINNEIQYPSTYSLSGDFEQHGPLPSNAYLELN